MVEFLNVSYGLCQAPFNATHFNTAMAADRLDKKVYKCGQNWWRHNLIWSPNPGAAWLKIFDATWYCPYLFASLYEMLTMENFT